MICPRCGNGNLGGDHYDTGCRRCGYEADESYQADADEAADNKRRDKKLRSEDDETRRRPS